MRRILSLSLSVLMLLFTLNSFAQSQVRRVSIDFSGPHVADDLNGLDFKLDYNATYQFTVSAMNTDFANGATLGFLFYSPDGSMVNATVGVPTLFPAWSDPSVWTLGGALTNVTLLGDGVLPDQYLTGGAAFGGQGFNQASLTPIFTFDVAFGEDEGVFCIDSAFYPPSGAWLFSAPGFGDVPPEWIAGSGDAPVGGTRTDALCLTIFGPPDDPPVFSSCQSALTRNYCTAASYTVTATDPEGVDAIIYSGAHDGTGTLSVNATSGSVVYTPAFGDAGNVVQVTVTATEDDGKGKSSDCITSITVTQTPPSITCPTNLNVTQGTSKTSSNASASDPDACETQVFALVSVTPAPVGTVTVSPTTGAVTFNSDPAEPLVAYQVCIQVTSGGQSSSCCFTVSSVPDTPPTFNSCPSTLSRSYCSNANYSAAATDPEAESAISYSGIHDGDGSLTVNASSGAVSYSPTSVDIGNIVQVVVTATESDGPSSDCVTDISVTQTAPSITCPANIDAIQGRTTNSGFPSVSDPDACETRVFALVSVTPTPVGTVTVSAATGRVTFNSDPAEPLAVAYQVCIQVTAGDQTGDCCFTITSVPDNPPVFGSCTSALTRSYCDIASYSVSASDPEGVSPISYSGSHDGAGSLSVNASTGSVLYTPNAGDIGNVVQVTVTAAESDGPSANCITNITVTQTPPSIICPPDIEAFAGNSEFSEMPTVSDPDGCETFSYSLVSVTPAPMGTITVASTTGRVTFNSHPDEPQGVDYDVCIEVTSGGQSASCCMVVTAAAGCCVVPGDANGSATVDISDVVFIIAHMFAGAPAPACQDEADANGDNALNILDVTRLISFIFAGGVTPVCGTTGS